MASTDARIAEQEAVSAQTSEEHDALITAMHKLERALVSAAPGRESEWAQRVAADLRDVRHELAQHRQSAEAADGLFAEIARAMPAAQYQLGKLRQAHGAMLDETDAPLASVERMGAGEPGSFDAVRQRASALLSGLRTHQAQEVDLVYEAFNRDISGID